MTKTFEPAHDGAGCAGYPACKCGQAGRSAVFCRETDESDAAADRSDGATTVAAGVPCSCVIGATCSGLADCCNDRGRSF
jgi:hypothetical protein